MAHTSENLTRKNEENTKLAKILNLCVKIESYLKLQWVGSKILPNVVFHFTLTYVTQPCFRPRIHTLCLKRFQRCKTWPSVTSLQAFFATKILLNSTLRQSEIQAHINFLLARLPEQSTAIPDKKGWDTK